MTNQNELIAEVKKAISEFEGDNKFDLPAKALNNLFRNFPLNNNMEEVLIKATSINSLYSTNIFNIVAVAKNIAASNIDPLLVKKDLSVLYLIAKGHGISTEKGTERNFYSFATKYCHFHSPNDYPIYDSYVEIALKDLKKEGKISFTVSDLQFYDRFKEVIQRFRSSNGLGQFNIEEIDHYLWLKGKNLDNQRQKKYFKFPIFRN